jgi:hypothetical protein
MVQLPTARVQVSGTTQPSASVPAERQSARPARSRLGAVKDHTPKRPTWVADTCRVDAFPAVGDDTMAPGGAPVDRRSGRPSGVSVTCPHYRRIWMANDSYPNAGTAAAGTAREPSLTRSTSQRRPHASRARSIRSRCADSAESPYGQRILIGGDTRFSAVLAVAGDAVQTLFPQPRGHGHPLTRST